MIHRCAALRPGEVTTVGAASKHALRAIARRWLALDAEIKDHAAVLTELTERSAPQLVAAVGLGPDTASDLLIAAGDNPGRIRSEAAWARLCGVVPIPASSGKTTRYRLHRGGHRPYPDGPERDAAMARLCAAYRESGLEPWRDSSVWWRPLDG